MIPIGQGEHCAPVPDEVHLVSVARGVCRGGSCLQFSDHKITNVGISRQDGGSSVHGLMEPLPHDLQVSDLNVSHDIPHPVVGALDGRSGPLRGEAPSQQCSQEPLSRPGRLLRALRALEDHWLGDLIGALSLFAALWLGLVAGAVMQ